MDIETKPGVSYFWDLRDDNTPLERVVSTPATICFSAKWIGERGVTFHSARDGHREMIEAAHTLLDEADVVLHYNGKRFDIPHLNREFIQTGMTPPSPYKQIDLYHVVRSRFKFASNKLAHVAPELGLRGKIKHSGFDLWVRCMAGDDKAWREMERYNRRDVVLLEELYAVVQPWISSHPNRALYDGGGCPTCGGTRLQRRGTAYTAVGAFPQFHCQGCGGYFRSGQKVGGTDLRQVAG